MNLMTDSSHIAMKSQFIKTLIFFRYRNIKNLADINPGFMKPYLIIKEMPHNL